MHKELSLFSVADNQRSIPCVVDGLKPSQRKVLFACFKRKLRREIKVAQLAGYVSEHSAYHHGEASLTGTIVGMAQDFVGSNNVNLLAPCGQFGTRIMGGKDAASSRYIFTKLEAVARKVFHPDDDAVLKYLDDDGQSTEPNYYVPVLPLALCNGADGIGTGWATSVPNYDPKQLIAVLRRMIAHAGDDVDCDETSLLATCAAEDVGADGLAPSYRGFKGDVILKKAGSYQALGRVERLDDTKVLIDELPLRKWTHDYKQWCARGVLSLPDGAVAACQRARSRRCARCRMRADGVDESAYAIDAPPRRLEQQIVGDDKTTAWLKVRVRRPREFNSLLRHRRDASRTVRFPHRISRRTTRTRPSHPVHKPNCRGSFATAESRPSRHRRDVHPTHWLICAQVSFTVTALSGAKLDEAEKAPGGLLKKFKLESSMATSNMNFFDSGGATRRHPIPTRRRRRWGLAEPPRRRHDRSRTRRPYAAAATRCPAQAWRLSAMRRRLIFARRSTRCGSRRTRSARSVMRRPFRDAFDATVASMAYELYQTLRPNAAVAMLARTHTYPPGRTRHACAHWHAIVATRSNQRRRTSSSSRRVRLTYSGTRSGSS